MLYFSGECYIFKEKRTKMFNFLSKMFNFLSFLGHFPFNFPLKQGKSAWYTGENHQIQPHLYLNTGELGLKTREIRPKRPLFRWKADKTSLFHVCALLLIRQMGSAYIGGMSERSERMARMWHTCASFDKI